ncbi:hypothetical protein B0I37DRAFT_367137 [Chaetomium sp. MPI-CAGE-AT-0009]|nr:hypothetical protein B0I37DRAFT_367137 [Chaetomium sp. MPI-CAGE-AT-0009]
MSENDGGTGSTEVGSLAVAIVALVVALVALLGTTAQVFQQYLATAAGYSNCGKRVMGPWARHTKLVFHPWELRFEVVFRSPDITVMAPRPDSAGDVNDMQSWDVEEPMRPRQLTLNDKNNEDIIADYSATWLALLSTVRSMLREGGPPSGSQSETVSVRVHAKLQTLDLMPEGVKKPYATTTLGSIVVLAGMLGLHWKQFDRTNDRYVADGNGLLFTGFSVPHLGIMFTFTRYDIPRFPPASRVIPTVGLLEYCFGLVPTVFRPSSASLPRYLTDVPRDLGTLRLGSPLEIASTLALLQCDRWIIESLGSIEHVFPVVFELVGMLGRPMHMRGIPGRTLPNPLPYRWDDKRFSPRRLLIACANQIRNLSADILANETELVGVVSSLGEPSQASTHAPHDLFCLLPESEPNFLHKLHDTVDWCDKWLCLRNYESKQETLLIVRTHINTFWGSLLKVRDAEQVGKLFDLHLFLEHIDKVHLEERETMLVKMYFDVICRGKRLWESRDEDSRRTWDELLALHNRKTARRWLVLMLRMMCWLNLHTFHASDVQLPKSDLMGTRLPVYIS